MKLYLFLGLFVLLTYVGPSDCQFGSFGTGTGVGTSTGLNNLGQAHQRAIQRIRNQITAMINRLPVSIQQPVRQVYAPVLRISETLTELMNRLPRINLDDDEQINIPEVRARRRPRYWEMLAIMMNMQTQMSQLLNTINTQGYQVMRPQNGGFGSGGSSSGMNAGLDSGLGASGQQLPSNNRPIQRPGMGSGMPNDISSGNIRPPVNQNGFESGITRPQQRPEGLGSQAGIGSDISGSGSAHVPTNSQSGPGISVSGQGLGSPSLPSIPSSSAAMNTGLGAMAIGEGSGRGKRDTADASSAEAETEAVTKSSDEKALKEQVKSEAVVGDDDEVKPKDQQSDEKQTVHQH